MWGNRRKEAVASGGFLMREPILDMVDARAEAERLLDELGLRAYIFTLEPKEPGWQLTVDCAVEGGWQTVTLPIDPEELRAAVHDAAARERLRTAWGERLGTCLRGPGSRST
jgi:hypothetical protein